MAEKKPKKPKKPAKPTRGGPQGHPLSVPQTAKKKGQRRHKTWHDEQVEKGLMKPTPGMKPKRGPKKKPSK